MQVSTKKLKKVILRSLPYLIFGYAGDLIGYAYRTTEGDGFQEKILPFLDNLGVAFAKVFTSLHPLDIFVGLGLAGVMRLVLYIKSQNKKNSVRARNTALPSGAVKRILNHIWTTQIQKTTSFSQRLNF